MQQFNSGPQIWHAEARSSKRPCCVTNSRRTCPPPPAMGMRCRCFFARLVPSPCIAADIVVVASVAFVYRPPASSKLVFWTHFAMEEGNVRGEKQCIQTILRLLIAELLPLLRCCHPRLPSICPCLLSLRCSPISSTRKAAMRALCFNPLSFKIAFEQFPSFLS